MSKQAAEHLTTHGGVGGGTDPINKQFLKQTQDKSFKGSIIFIKNKNNKNPTSS